MKSQSNRLPAIFPSIHQKQVDLLEDYVQLLRSYNRKLNLISRADIDNLWSNHIYPSLLINNLLHFPAGVAVMDFGSGGGLPGIPLKIIRPDLQMVLLDSSHKKTAFLRMAVGKLHLDGIDVVRRRVSAGQSDPLHGKFHVVTARAVADFEELFRLTGPFLKEDGFLLAWKGVSDMDSLEQCMQKGQKKYRVIKIPESFQQYSGKFEHLRYVQVFLNQQDEDRS